MMRVLYLALATLAASTTFAASVDDDVGGIGNATAPVDDEFPEVIPGEGLPSLASLNLTSADLYDANFGTKFGTPDPDEESMNVFATSGAGNCNTYLTDAPVAGARACRRYLTHLGTKVCRLHHTNSGVYQATFCRAGRTKIIGGNPGRPAHSYCRDVATGAQWVINHCTHQGTKVSGQQAAGGNGNLIVGITKRRHK